MIYVWEASWKPNVGREESDATLARRAKWTYPEGLRPLGEYWLSSSHPAVVVIFEAESFAPFMELTMTWGDVFDITCSPATTADEGLKLGSEALRHRAA